MSSRIRNTDPILEIIVDLEHDPCFYQSSGSRKIVEIKSALIFLLVDERIRTDPGPPVQIITDMDPDPDSGGTKTYGSYGFGTQVMTYSV